jgi:hypothetical protein
MRRSQSIQSNGGGSARVEGYQTRPNLPRLLDRQQMQRTYELLSIGC